MSTEPEHDLSTVLAQSQAIWDRNAAFWDEKMGEGNQFQRLLVGPASEELLAIRPGEYVLEIGCGNGLFARRLVQLGARVLATDFSARMLELALARTVENAEQIEYRQVDATNAGQLEGLGEHRFDAIVSNMAIMDMAEIEPLLRAVPALLAPSGRFVFSLMHPCFNHSGTTLVAEEEDRDGQLITTDSVRVVRYKSVGTTRGLAIIGQPSPQYYFHRTLADLFNTAFRAGLVMDGVLEPTFGPEVQAARRPSWANYQDIPPVLAVRLRVKHG